MNEVEKFLARLKASHPDMERIYTQGGCYELFLILRTVWPQARCYYSFSYGHVYTEIDGRFYDINGKYMRAPNGAVDFAVSEPHIMATAHRWSQRSFGGKVGRLLTPRELLGIPEQEHYMEKFKGLYRSIGLSVFGIGLVLLGVCLTLLDQILKLMGW